MSKGKKKKKKKEGNSTAFSGGRARREESNLLKRNIPVAVVQRNVTLEKFGFLIWIHACAYEYFSQQREMVGNPGSARSRAQTCFLDLSQTLPQGSRSLFVCVCVHVWCVHTYVCMSKCVPPYTCVFLFS